MLLQHLCPEHLDGGLPSEAFAGGGIQPVADFVDIVIREFADVTFSRQPAAGTAIGVLDSAFLPRCGGVAKPAPVPVSACRCGHETNLVLRSKMVDLRAGGGRARIAAMPCPNTLDLNFLGVSANRVG